MNLDWLTTFRAVVDAKSYTKAAEHLVISQPAVSKQLRRLEGFFGCQLLKRVGREFQLTPAGQRVYDLAAQIDSGILAARQDIRRSALNEHESVRIAGGPTPFVHFLAPALKRFGQRHPSITIRPTIGATDALDDLLLRGELDIAVLQDVFVLQDPLEIAATLLDEIIAVCAPEHPFAQRLVEPEEMGTTPVVCIRYGTESRRALDDWFGQRGVFFSRVLEVSTFTEVRVGAVANLGIGFLSRYSVEEDLLAGRLIQIAIAGFRLERPLFVVHRRDAGPLVRDLLWEIDLEASSRSGDGLKLIHAHFA